MRQDVTADKDVFEPDPRRRDELQEFVGTICVGSTGRLGIVTHVEAAGDNWRCAGFGLDGKGVWTSTNPTFINDAKTYYKLLNDRFNGALTYADSAVVGDIRDLRREVENIQAAVTGLTETFLDAAEGPLDSILKETT